MGVLLGALAPGSALALTVTPTRTDDPVQGGANCTEPPLDCSLRNAVAAVQPGGVVELRSGPSGPYELTRDGALTISTNAAVIGPGPRNMTIRRTGGSGPVISIHPRYSLDYYLSNPRPPRPRAYLRGLTISGGVGHGSDGAGGVFFGDADALLSDLAIMDNRSISVGSGGHGVGGGIMSLQSNVTVLDSVIADNVAEDSGGGGIGGGVYSGGSGGVLKIVNTTIANNEAVGRRGRGGGVYQAGGGFGPVTVLENVTMAGNTAAGGGGNIYTMSGDLALANSIVANGHGPRGRENCADNAAPLVSRGSNLESPSTQCGFDAPGDLQGVSDARLGPLQNNGGPTNTLALLPGALAIDAGPAAGCTDSTGRPILADQRKRVRPAGPRCDIGAFEADSNTDAPSRGCQVLEDPQQVSFAVVSTVSCETASRVAVTGVVVIGPPNSAARAASTAQASSTVRTSSIGRAVRDVKRGRRATVKLPLRRGLRARLRMARQQHRTVRFALTLKRRR